MSSKAALAPLDLEDGVVGYDAVLAEIKGYATSEGTYALPYVSGIFCILPAAAILWWRLVSS